MPDIYQNFLAGVLSADPGAAGTTLNSGNFAFMPAVAAPNTLRIVLDPEGVTGAPEICKVTAHTAFALTCTVTRGEEQAYGGGPGRAHATDSVWRHSLTRASISEMIADVTIPAATVSATLAATPDPGHLFLDGTTVVNAQTLYPATWARLPSSMKSGSSMLLPDARGATLMMDDAAALLSLGAMSGANTLTLLQAHLPAVGVTVDPPPTAVTGSTGDETFSPANMTSAFLSYQTGGSTAILRNPVATVHHQHPAGTLAVDIPPFSSGPMGSGTPINTTPRNLCINWQIKVH